MRYGVDQALTKADSDHHLSIDHEAYIIGGSHRQSVMGDFAVQQTNNKPNFRVLVIVLPSLAISIGSSVQKFAASPRALRPLGRRTRRSIIAPLRHFFFTKNPHYCSASGLEERRRLSNNCCSRNAWMKVTEKIVYLW